VDQKFSADVFIAMSLDGFIATKTNGLDWLEIVQDPQQDYGYKIFMDSIDTLLLGRNTYDIVCSFGDWPYSGKRVVVLSNRPIVPIADEIRMEGSLRSTLEELRKLGSRKIYLDGGKLIQQSLRENVVDSITLSIIPIILGEGIPLFDRIERLKKLKQMGVQSFPSGLVQIKYEPLKGET